MSNKIEKSLLKAFLNKDCSFSKLQNFYKKLLIDLLNEGNICLKKKDTSIFDKLLNNTSIKNFCQINSCVNYAKQDYKCIFVNGMFQWEQSHLPESCSVFSLSEAEDIFSDFFELQKERWEKKEKNLFFLLNGISFQEGIFLFFPKSLKETINLSLENIIDTSDLVVTPRIHILASDGVCLNVDIKQNYSSLLDRELFFNGVLDIFLGMSSSVTISKSSKKGIFHNFFEALSIRATLSEKASFINNLFHKQQGTSKVRYNFHILLEGLLSQAHIQSGMLLHHEAESEIKVQMDHLVESTFSQQTIKTIVDNDAKSNFEGGIFVASEAQKTNAYQKFSGLMLTDTSFVEVSPQLEILADDVKASHGASIKQLEEDLIFYLNTRGISRDYAQLLLTESFFSDLVLNTF